MSEIRFVVLHNSEQLTTWCVIIVIVICEEEQRHQIKFKPLAPLQSPATSGQTTQAKLPYSKENHC